MFWVHTCGSLRNLLRWDTDLVNTAFLSLDIRIERRLRYAQRSADFIDPVLLLVIEIYGKLALLGVEFLRSAPFPPPCPRCFKPCPGSFTNKVALELRERSE